MNHDALHILLAEDDDDDRLFFKDAIEEIKVKTVVTMVNDGVELMEYLHNPNIHLPHLVFLDLNMPRKNGMQCLKEIRSNPKLKELSIAVYSTSALEKDIEDTFINGANIYIKKPNDFEVLKNILAKVITINWQYHTSGLNKENFLLNIQKQIVEETTFKKNLFIFNFDFLFIYNKWMHLKKIKATPRHLPRYRTFLL